MTVAERYFVLTFAWWLLSTNAGGARLSLLMVVESLPTLVLGFLVGPLIDRAQKKPILLASTLIQTVVVGTIALFLMRGGLTFPMLCVAGFLLGCLLPVFEGSINAALPEVVEGRQLASAAAVQSATLELSNIVAAALSASVIAAFGFEVALLVNAALYATGSVFVMRLRFAPVPSEPEEASYLADLRAGVGYVLGQPGLAAFVFVYVAKLLLVAPLLVLIPMLVKDRLDEGVGWVGVLEVGFSVGSIVTALVVSLRRTHRRFYPTYAAGLALLGALMLILTRTDRPLVALPNVVVMGACVALLLSLAHILFQHNVPNRYKGRFFGILETLAAGVTPIGYALVGWTSQSGGVTRVLVVCGVGLVVLAFVLLVVPRIDAPLEVRTDGVET